MEFHMTLHDVDEVPLSWDARMAMTDWDKETTSIVWHQVSAVPILHVQ